MRRTFLPCRARAVAMLAPVVPAPTTITSAFPSASPCNTSSLVETGSGLLVLSACLSVAARNKHAAATLRQPIATRRVANCHGSNSVGQDMV